jgi:hypothetical protein
VALDAPTVYTGLPVLHASLHILMESAVTTIAFALLSHSMNV